jgi:ring-1,2-phenylacetyl-CoA epoxidase subunit PaaE
VRRYYPLTVLDKRRETRDSVRIALDVPEEARDAFAFEAGQHLPLKAEYAGQTLRRTYSICSPPGRWPLEIGVRVQPGGAFSRYADEVLEPGQGIEVMPPSGRFFHARPSGVASGRRYLAVAAGSGITPVLSIVSTILAEEPESRVTLFYGNRRQSTSMFIDDLYALKNLYPSRLQLQFLFSREVQEFPVATGRLDGEKLRELWTHFFRERTPDEAFVCGPGSMIDTVTSALVELGMAASAVHAERFGAPRRPGGEAVPAPSPAAHATVSVILDGHRRSFTMDADDGNIVDAAAAHGIELPYSCKGGVCATCRCRLVEGDVAMAVNYGLERWEIAKGYILACQSTPRSQALTLDYDTP